MDDVTAAAADPLEVCFADVFLLSNDSVQLR